MTSIDGLLSECDSCGIRLIPADTAGLTIDAPQGVLTAALLERLKASKLEILKLLRTTTEAKPKLVATATNSPAKLTEQVCPCGSTTWRDVQIHNGQSVRRDCARCDRFLSFPVWYGIADDPPI